MGKKSREKQQRREERVPAEAVQGLVDLVAQRISGKISLEEFNVLMAELKEKYQ